MFRDERSQHLHAYSQLVRREPKRGRGRPDRRPRQQKDTKSDRDDATKQVSSMMDEALSEIAIVFAYYVWGVVDRS